MAMNKKEQARVAELERNAALLAHTVNATARMPEAMPHPPYIGRQAVQSGYMVNVHGSWIRQTWRDGLYHYHTADLKNGYRDGGPLYATEADAALALYCLTRDKAAEDLAKIWERYVNASTTAVATAAIADAAKELVEQK